VYRKQQETREQEAGQKRDEKELIERARGKVLIKPVMEQDEKYGISAALAEINDIVLHGKGKFSKRCEVETREIREELPFNRMLPGDSLRNLLSIPGIHIRPPKVETHQKAVMRTSLEWGHWEAGNRQGGRKMRVELSSGVVSIFGGENNAKQKLPVSDPQFFLKYSEILEKVYGRSGWECRKEDFSA